ncbi:hypothetical protein WJR50_11470 [Catalinimonas sp. 4WD22]|uniref:hypothetical protein n=1 Tax=Catalinimonas locisalis TaxID=3133978 RepID=UPI003100D635
MSTKDIENVPEYPKNVQNLTTFEGFYDLFSTYLATAKTNKEAFDRANGQYARLFGHCKYSDYDSFRRMIRKHLSK